MSTNNRANLTDLMRTISTSPEVPMEARNPITHSIDEYLSSDPDFDATSLFSGDPQLLSQRKDNSPNSVNSEPVSQDFGTLHEAAILREAPLKPIGIDLVTVYIPPELYKRERDKGTHDRLFVKGVKEYLNHIQLSLDSAQFNLYDGEILLVSNGKHDGCRKRKVTGKSGLRPASELDVTTNLSDYIIGNNGTNYTHLGQSPNIGQGKNKVVINFSHNQRGTQGYDTMKEIFYSRLQSLGGLAPQKYYFEVTRL